METWEKVFLALCGLAVVAIFIAHRKNPTIAVDPLAAGKGPAPFANIPPTSDAGAFAAMNTAPWGTVPPVSPMLTRASGIAGIALENSGDGNDGTGGRVIH